MGGGIHPVEIIPMKSIAGWTAMFNLCAILAANSIFAQVRVVAHACTKEGNQYICDKSNFEKILHVAKTVSIRTPRLQPSSEQSEQACAKPRQVGPIRLRRPDFRSGAT